ncbi:MerR family DNA-binding transcriptional regulator [Carnobacterium sp. 17-4]
MEYTVNALSRLTGVSKRTLRYYDENQKKTFVPF